MNRRELSIVGQNLLQSRHLESNDQLTLVNPALIRRSAYAKITWAVILSPDLLLRPHRHSRILGTIGFRADGSEAMPPKTSSSSLRSAARVSDPGCWPKLGRWFLTRGRFTAERTG